MGPLLHPLYGLMYTSCHTHSYGMSHTRMSHTAHVNVITQSVFILLMFWPYFLSVRSTQMHGSWNIRQPLLSVLCLQMQWSQLVVLLINLSKFKRRHTQFAYRHANRNTRVHVHINIFIYLHIKIYL